MVESTTFNTRFQPAQIVAGSLMTLGLAYGTGSSGTAGDNGNVQSETINWMGTNYRQYFSYDYFNRLLGVVENLSGGAPNTYGSGFTCPGGSELVRAVWI